jgi:hypothetical protein
MKTVGSFEKMAITNPPTRYHNKNNLYVGFRVLRGVIRMSYVFWDITPCIPVEVNRRFGGTRHLHLQGYSR